MNFSFNITIPAGTPQDDPYTYIMKLDRGIVYDFEIISSTGCNGEVYCYITDLFDNKIFPRNPDGVYKLWGQVIKGRYPSCKFKLTGTNMHLKFVGYSPDASYDHTITVSFWIVKDEDIPLLEKATSFEEISGLIKNLGLIKEE